MKKEKMTVKKTILSALFLAIGLVLPFITMQIPAVGKMLCPMHIPVLLCGYICGWPYGLIVGFVTPLLRGGDVWNAGNFPECGMYGILSLLHMDL